MANRECRKQGAIFTFTSRELLANLSWYVPIRVISFCNVVGDQYGCSAQLPTSSCIQQHTIRTSRSMVNMHRRQQFSVNGYDRERSGRPDEIPQLLWWLVKEPWKVWKVIEHEVKWRMGRNITRLHLASSAFWKRFRKPGNSHALWFRLYQTPPALYSIHASSTYSKHDRQYIFPDEILTLGDLNIEF